MFCRPRFSTGTITLGWEKITFAISECISTSLIEVFLPKKITDFQQDFEDFDLANEDDVLEEFLGIERENPKEKYFCQKKNEKNHLKNKDWNFQVEPYKTGAVAPEVGKREALIEFKILIKFFRFQFQI